MNYYHGSPEKFDQFDLTTKDNGSEYLYTVIVKGDGPHRQYHSGMSNLSFAQTDNLEIINTEFVSK